MKTKLEMKFQMASCLLAWFAVTLLGSVLIGQEVSPKSDDRKTQTEMAVCKETKDAIALTIGGKPFLTYYKSVVQPPAGVDAVYQRSGYIHPIQTPSGREVTGDFAPDHAHQHAFLMAWVSTQFAGHDVDFWNQAKKSGRISHSKVLGVRNQDSFAEFEVELSYEDITTPEPILVLSERWKVRAHHQVAGQPFVFDFESHQTCVADSALTLKEYHYGGFGLRGNRQWYKPDAKTAFRAWSKQVAEATKKANKDPAINLPEPPSVQEMGHGFLTSENKQRHDGNHTSARWTAMYGPVDKELAGIAILCHPKNFRAPQPVRLHPTKPYFSYVPVVGGEFQIKPKETYTTRFRVVSFDGEPNKAILNQLWNDYSKE